MPVTGSAITSTQQVAAASAAAQSSQSAASATAVSVGGAVNTDSKKATAAQDWVRESGWASILTGGIAAQIIYKFLKSDKFSRIIINAKVKNNLFEVMFFPHENFTVAFESWVKRDAIILEKNTVYNFLVIREIDVHLLDGLFLNMWTELKFPASLFTDLKSLIWQDELQNLRCAIVKLQMKAIGFENEVEITPQTINSVVDFLEKERANLRASRMKIWYGSASNNVVSSEQKFVGAVVKAQNAAVQMPSAGAAGVAASAAGAQQSSVSLAAKFVKPK